MPSSRVSSQPRDRIQVSRIAGGFFMQTRARRTPKSCHCCCDSIHPNEYLLRAHYSPALCQDLEQHLLPRIMRYSDILLKLLVDLTISNNIMGCGKWTGSLVEIRTQMLLQIGLGPSSEEQAMVELRPVRQQSGFTHSGSLLLQGQ